MPTPSTCCAIWLELPPSPAASAPSSQKAAQNPFGQYGDSAMNRHAAARQASSAHCSVQHPVRADEGTTFDRFGSPSEIATRHFGGIVSQPSRACRRFLPMTKLLNGRNRKEAKNQTGQGALTTRDNSALIGTACKILRKDKGLNGDVDRLPLLTWVMFLKFLDDLEVVHEEEAELDGKPYHPIIEAPYRWRDWAAREDGLTGDELLAFINQDECHRADGSRGAGLFAWLRALAGSGEKGSQREVIANVFRGVQNRMVSGYLLRDIIHKINSIHFSSSSEIHTLSHLYESMLREMRDAAGDSGEFYTPRPVVRFMVQVSDPSLGEIVLDPACGTGGFLVEAYDHIALQVTNPDQRRTLQRDTLFGQEAKPLPYMLAQMNLLLHGLEAPQIAYGNTLERRIDRPQRTGGRDLTNPPFGGEEEAGIKANFPANMQTAETALVPQYIMRKLRYAGHGADQAAAASCPTALCLAMASAPSSRRRC